MKNNEFNTGVYNPDVLSCLANLSNDEVFTPPEIANQMLDMLPQELFSDSNAKFLDPVSKSGVFLREIAKRLMTGLEPVIPDLQQRIDHIFHNQIYGIAITEMTSLLSRRSVYCSKYPNSIYSISKFDNADGHIRYKKIKHKWENGRCSFCGASQKEYERDAELESHAYELIHMQKPEEVLTMKFDVIIGNPPYQLSLGGEGGNSFGAKALYHLFVSQAIKLNPKYLVMIIPSRWMTRAAKGISDEWVKEMIECNKFKEIHDFPDAKDCFPGVSIMGGVNYFLWSRDYSGKCRYVYHGPNKANPLSRLAYLDAMGVGIVMRDPKSYSIIEKVTARHGQYYLKTDANFSGLVSPNHFFGKSGQLYGGWTGYADQKDAVSTIKYYLNVNNKRTYKWISLQQIAKNFATRDLNKVYIPEANGSLEAVLGKPFYGEPNSVCSKTYLVIGYDVEKHNFTKEQCINIISYITTKFFRYLVAIKKSTQQASRGVYQFVPLQDFSKPWTDEELYEMYGLTDDEIELIESSIRPMDLGGKDNDK